MDLPLGPVSSHRGKAEVDRVWKVTPELFAQPITYVLKCKWGLVRTRDVDDFFEVLRWSKEFSADTPKGTTTEGCRSILTFNSRFMGFNYET